MSTRQAQKPIRNSSVHPGVTYFSGDKCSIVPLSVATTARRVNSAQRAAGAETRRRKDTRTQRLIMGSPLGLNQRPTPGCCARRCAGAHGASEREYALPPQNLEGFTTRAQYWAAPPFPD
jgi:hypothetical protein